MVVDGGRDKSEVRWNLKCGDSQIISEESGRAPYDRNVSLPICSDCQLAMRDTYGDSWGGNRFVGFGLNETVTRTDNSGRSKAVNFTSPGCPPSNDTDTEESTEEETEEETPDTTDSKGMVRGNVTVGGGTYKDEVRWNISCNGDIKISEEQGRAPYSNVVALPSCTNCTLNMRDTYSDTWSGNFFIGFGLNETVTSSDNSGRFKSVDFNT